MYYSIYLDDFIGEYDQWLAGSVVNGVGSGLLLKLRPIDWPTILC